MTECGFELNKLNSDKMPPCSYGKSLVELCQVSSILLLNGRVGKDRYSGKSTTKHGTVIDYFMSSCNLFPLINSFAVEDFDPLYSDVHCAIKCSFIIGDSTALQEPSPMHFHLQNETIQEVIPIEWIEEKKDIFKNNFSLEKVQHILEFCECSDFDVNTATNMLKRVFIDVASKSFSVITNKSVKKISKPRKEWFNTDCKAARKAYHSAKHSNNIKKTIQSHELLVSKSREYKKVLAKARTDFKKDLQIKLRLMKKHKPKDYFKLLNSRKKYNCKVDLNTMYLFMKDMMYSDITDNEFDIYNMQNNLLENEECQTILNCRITEEEIYENVKKLKLNKAKGIDLIKNEYIKCSLNVLMPIYMKIFNRILDTGNIPDDWLTGIVLPLYKNKGDPLDPDNYRGITLLSCLSKLFTSIINSRLVKFADSLNLLNENQAGFRNGYSTVDHIFLLKNVIDLFITNKRKLFCAFIDYRKAFDTVWHAGLWYKLIQNNISGKVFNVIQNMYKNIKSCVTINKNKSDFFVCNIGVRQGENLSPFLFALYLNDLQNFLCNENCNYLNFGVTEINVYLKLLVLLYADDTVILADSALNLQLALNKLEDYCTKWKLSVNISKSKVCIFSKRKTKTDTLHFKYNDSIIEIVDHFQYLGVIFKYNGSFKLCIEKLFTQGQKAMFSVLQKCRKYDLPIDLQLDLFDKMVLPILTYGCEVWGLENMNVINIIEKLHLKFCKYVLNVKSSTPTVIVYGELGRYPLYIDIYARMVKFWMKILTGESEKLSFKIMNAVNFTNVNLPWQSKIREILYNCGLYAIWDFNTPVNTLWLSKTVKQKLSDLYLSEWRQTVYNSSKCYLYRIYKIDIKFEEYLIKLNPNLRRNLCKLRTVNHKLPIETDRYKNIPRNERHCSLCREPVICDEFHIIFKCKNLVNLRKKYLPFINSSSRNVSVLKLFDIFDCQGEQLNNLALFAKYALAQFN